MDHSSSSEERAKKKSVKQQPTRGRDETNHVAFKSKISVKRNIAITAINELLVRTASKSQQDKTIIMK